MFGFSQSRSMCTVSAEAIAAAVANPKFWKLKGVYKWVTVAPYISKIHVTFDPASPHAMGLRCVRAQQ